MIRKTLQNKIQNLIKPLFKAIKHTSQVFIVPARPIQALVALTLVLVLVSASYSPVQAKSPKKFKPTQVALNVFPTAVSSDTWGNINTIGSQDLGENSLLQDFNGNNSAYLGSNVKIPKTEPSPTPVTPPVTESGSGSEPSPEEGGDEVIEVTPDVDSVPQPEVEDISEPVVEEPSVEDSSIQESPASSGESAVISSPLIFSVIKFLTNSFKLAVSEIVKPIPSAAAQEVTESVSEVINTPITPEVIPEVVPEPEPEVGLEAEPEVVIPVIEETASGSTSVIEFEEQIDEDEDKVLPMPQTGPAHTISFTGFDVPNFESGQFIDNLQLRLSLAGSYNANTEELLPSLKVSYSFETFSGDAGTVLLDDEISNALNGGYYLIPFPQITDPELLSDLTVTITFDGDMERLDSLYLDAAWLEVTTVVYSKELLMERFSLEEMYKHLKAPDFMEFMSEQIDFGRDELPRFNLRYESQKNALVQALRSLFSSEFATISEVVFSRNGNIENDITPDVSITDDGLISITLSEADAEILKPGTYEVDITVDEGGETVTDSFEFQWGLLTINTNQTEYGAVEVVDISMGALTSKGNTICDADLNLFITDPTGFISSVPVAASGQCFGNNVVDVPDYSTQFVTDAFGEYEMYLEKVDESGSVVSHITETFLVVPNQDMAIERTGPTRIFPPAQYSVELSVHALTRSFNGQLIERVPAGFEIFDTDAEIREQGNYKELIWDISMLSENTESVSYSFDAPDISPYLFNLGAAKLVTDEEVTTTSMVEVIPEVDPNSTSTEEVVPTYEEVSVTSSEETVIFQEHRRWQIASDALQPGIPALAESPAFDNILVKSTRPKLGGFAAYDPDGDVVEYEIQIDDDINFGSVNVNAGSVNFPTDSGWSSATFASGATTTYTVRPADALTNGVTYWWRVRAKDPADTNTWTSYSQPRSVTIDTSTLTSRWHQTLGHQFGRGTLTGLATTTGAVSLPVSTTVPTLVPGWTVNSVNPGASLTLTKPASVNVGDLLIIIVGDEDTTNTAQWDNTTNKPTGFTLIQEAGDATADAHVAAFYRVADGTEGATVDVPSQSSDGYWGFYMRVTGADPVTPINVIGAGGTSGNTTSKTIPSITTTVANTLAFYALASDGGDNDPFSVSGTGWVEADERESGTTGNDASGTWGTRSMTSAGATGNATVSMSASDGASYFQFAVNPAPVNYGTIMSPEIDFDWVVGQDTWGDVSWSVTQPAGTLTNLQVYYSNVAACDTRVPDIALPGNSTGFTSADSGLYIFGLSTSTYNRICLRMALDLGTGGSAPSLNDWTVRYDLPNQTPIAPVITNNPAFDNLFATTTPVLGTFSTFDYDGDNLEYQIVLDNDYNFSSPVFTKQSSNYPTDSGWDADTYASSNGGAWYNPSWPYRVPVTISSGLINEPLSNFPVYVKLASLGSGFFADLTASGGDIRVTSADGITEMPREVFGVSTGSGVGELYFEASSLSDEDDTLFYIYYGNAGASDYAASATYGSQNVWANNYEAVYHMEADPSAGAPQYIDSTGNSAGTAGSMEGADRVTGLAGYAADIDGVDEQITTTYTGGVFSNSTWSIWLNADGTQGGCDSPMFTRGGGGSVTGLNVGACGSTGKIGYHWNDTASSYNWTGGPNYPTDEWFLASMVVVPTQATIYAFTAGGVTSGSNVLAHASTNVNALTFGRDPSGAARSFDGTMEEARLSSVARSQNWLSAEYYNIASSSDFYATSSRQSQTFSNATYRIQPADALSDGTTYYWKVRARDPLGTNVWGDYSEARSLTIDTSLIQLGWHQTLGYQFEDGILTNMSTTTTGVQLTTIGVGSVITTDTFESLADGNTTFAGTTIWKQATVSTDDGSWQAETAATASGTTGPDAASQGSVFIYTEASSGGSCDNTGTANNCAIEANIVDGTLDGIQFDYHMFGNNMGTLSLDLYDGSAWTTVWTRTGAQSVDELDWLDSGYLDLVPYKDSTTVMRFFADGDGGGYSGDFALDNIRISTSTPSTGVLLSPEVDFSWVPDDSDWGLIEWDVTEPVGTDSRMRVYYSDAGVCDTMVPNIVLPGNAAGFDKLSSPIFIDGLSTTTYDKICLRMTLDAGGTASSPVLENWSVKWVIPNQVPSIPSLATLPAFNNMKSSTTAPVFGGFSSTDYEDDSIEFQIVIDDDYAFGSPTLTKQSSNYPTDAGWSAATFSGNSTTTYAIQSGDELVAGTTYWWKVRARDPLGSNEWSEYSSPKSMTISSVLNYPEWYQTTSNQFITSFTTKRNATSTPGGMTLATTTSSVRSLDPWSTTNTKTISDGSNRLLLVSIISEDSGVNTNVNTVTYGGQTLTQIEDQNIGLGFSNGMWVGYLNEAGIAAAVGTTITPTWVGGTPNNGIGYNVATFENVRQSVPVRDKSYNAYTSGQNTTPAAAISVFTGDMMVYFSETAQTITHTAATGYTEGIEQEVIISGDEFTHASAYKKITANGSEYPTAIWSATGNRLLMVALDLAPSPATASIMSPEVDFDWVAGQSDWGEVIWNVNEPTGSDSIVQVYYSNVGVCDTLIPNGTLTGNAVGFDAADSPINIAALSTSTYNRICLKSTLSHGTVSSASLLDWGISWEQSAVFEQSGYRWYVNNNSITPTDTWPAGATAFELSENQPINSAQPTQTGDLLRLRMGARVTSVAATANQFKLQYSEAVAETCSADSTWYDVAPISSSTALWKGYNNASVADGATLPSSLLSLTNVRQTYEEENTTSVIPNVINVGQYAEWDWVLENKATPGISYCFRMTTPDGKRFKTYTNYPKLVTNKAPTIASAPKPFDNEKLADTTPEFIFTGVDAEGNPVDYQVQIDNDVDFSSTVIDHNSISNFTYFNNIQTPADKSPFNQSEKISYIVPSALSNGVTYWWRVRAIDPDNSATYGPWSTSKSFTIDTSVTITTWFQTTEEQFDTDTLVGTDATAADRVSFAGGFSAGTTTSTAIDFDDLTTGNAWGQLLFTETGAANDILYHMEYYNGYTWELISDGALSGNAAGYDNSPVSLIDLDTETYNQIRIRANFRNGSPSLDDWTITWGERVSVPTHFSLFDNEKTDNTLPTFTFFSTDPQSDDLVYEFSYSTDNTFVSSTTVNSAVAPGFVNLTNGADTSPFTSGDTISYTVQSALSNNVTYWWRARAKDPAGGDSYSFWSDPWSFTISSTATTSTWFQTTEEQFNTDNLVSLATLGADSITTIPAAVATYNFLGVTSPSATHVARDFEVDVNDPTDPPTVNAIDTLTISGTSAGSPNLRSGIAGYASDAEATNAQYTSLSASDNNRWTITPPGAGDNAVFWAKFHVDEVGANISQLDILLEGYQQSATDVAWLGIWRPGTTTPYWQDLSHSQRTSDFNYTGSITSNITEYLDGNNDVHIIFFNEDDDDSLFVDFVQLTVTSDTATAGKITGTPIDFNDGSGPAWGQMTWADTKPGASTIKYQVEYLNGVGVWELIPNAALSGNAAGFTSSPVDLKFLNTTTYNEIRPVANLTCAGASCPTLNDWTIEWSRGFTVSGTAVEYGGVASTTSGTVAVAVNGVLQIGKTGTISAGAWSISNVTYFSGDVVTVFVSAATDADEAVAITKYDGTPDITGMKLQKRHLTIGSNDNATITNVNIGLYDVAEDEDLFYSVDGGNDLNMCADVSCSDAGLVVLAGNSYTPAAGADLRTHDFVNNGSVTLSNNIWRVSGSYDNNATTTMGASTVMMTATSGAETVDSTGSTLATFFNLTFGETSGSATWTLNSSLDVDGALLVNYGTMARGTQPIFIARNLTIGASGFWTGIGTTTFDGINPTTWADNNATDQNIGRVVVDGTSKTMVMSTSGIVQSMNIGANDIFDLNGQTITVNENWTNLNTFSANLGTVIFASTAAGRTIATNGSSFYNTTFNGVGGSWAFTNPTLNVSNNLTISNGTVTMPTATTTVTGSFNSTGGLFAHNNGTLLFNSNTAKTITFAGGAFTNTAYNMVFDGAGSWSITDTNATSSNDVQVKSGALTLPSGVMAIGGSLADTGGSYNPSTGTVNFYSSAAKVLTAGGSNFNNVIFSGVGSWSFTDTSFTTLGNFTVTQGALTLPNGTSTIGGSYTNSATVVPGTGTVEFNATSTGKTLNFGSSSLYNVVVNGTTGGWTLNSNATTTNNFSLVNAGSWTLATTRILSVGSLFTNSVGGASTTWTGSTLNLSGPDHQINSKVSNGDVYATIQTFGDTDISMWNSSSTSFVTASTSSVYSQDHAAVDGDLYIFGNYTRTTGTEYWSRATDFDGASLVGFERAVNVRVASSSVIGLENASFNILGGAGASTTVASLSGTFGLSASNTAITAQYFTVAGTNSQGFAMTASTTVPTFSDGYFAVGSSNSGITVDRTTIDSNVSKQIFRVGFATTTAGTATNVTQTGGAPVSSWWFRDSFGNIYGEAFDSDTGNPGSITWDNSTFGITISGTVYSDEAVTALSYPICDDVTPVVKVVVNGGTSYSGACSSVNGSYSISAVSYSGDPNIVTYINSNGAASQPAAVTLRSETTGTGTTNVTTGVFTVNKPATVSNGDLLVVIIGKDDSPAITAPAGWTTGDSLGSGAGNLIRSGIWYKRVTNAATEPASYTFTGDINEGFSYWIGSLVNADPVSPQNVSFTGRWVNSQNSVTPTAAAMTTVGNGVYVLGASYIDNDNAVTAPGFPWSTRAVNVFSTDNNNLVVSSRSMASPGVTGTHVVTGVAGGMESNNAQFGFTRMTYASSTVRGVVVTRTPTVSISNMDIYQNRVIVRHENTSPLAISNMSSFQNSNDTDIPYSVTLGSPNVLNTLYGSELHVWTGKTFAPAGNITLQGSGSANSYDGSLHLGSGSTLTGSGTSTYSIAGNITQETGATFIPASTTVQMTATTTGKAIVPASGVTLPFNALNFTGVGGAWNLNGNISSTGGIQIATGTVTGTGNITVSSGSLFGDGVLSLGGGTTTISKTNTLGGTRAWTFFDLILGNGSEVGTTTPAGTATTTVTGKLTIANAHTLNAGTSVWDLAGTGNVFVKTGTLSEGTSTFRYSGAGSNVLPVSYYNLLISAGVGTATYTATGGSLLVKNNLTVGGATNSILNVNTSDPALEVRGNVAINSNGTLEASNSASFNVLSNWTNLGTFNGNSGTVNFTGTGTSNIAAGNSSFSNVIVNGTGNFNVTQNATSTGNFTLTNHNVFTVNSAQRLAVGGSFTNTLGGAATTWTGSTLSLYGTGNYSINTSATNDVYGTLAIGSGTQVKMWNSSATAYSVNANGSLYSQDHASVDGNLYIWGKLTRTSGADYWSYATDFDGTSLTGVERVANVYFASGASAAWSGGSLTAIGGTGATTTIQNQGSGTYGLTMGTGSTVNWSRVQVRDTNSSGVVIAGTTAVTDFSRTDHLVAINSGTAITLGGTVINANPAKNFTNNVFAASGGVTSPVNVTATGTSISSWRFTNHTGNIAGEAYDSDPAGDPGYVVWDDSAALITVAGNVYSDEGVTVSPACDGSTNNIRLVVAGITTYNTSCNASTGAYSITNVAFGPIDTLTLYINDEPEKAANVSTSPISSISNMNLYENRVIVRHENTDPLTIANMAVWDSSDDADIQFTAIDAGTDTLTIPATNKLLIWTGKTFEPNGNITLTGGAGTAYNGMLEAQDNAVFRAKGTENHIVGGSVVFGTGAVYTSASSTLTLTSTGAGRTFDVNGATVNNLTVTGSGSWNMTDSTFTAAGSYTQSAGTMTFPTGTTTIGAAFNATGGTFVNNGSPFFFTSGGAGNTVRFNNSLVRSLDFTGTGSWNMTDTNATSTGSVIINSGTLTLPSGNFGVGGDFKKLAGTIVHNTSDIIMTATTTAVVTASSSDLYAIKFAGPAAYTITDANITFLDSFTIASGSVLVGTGTMSVGGSFIATGGTFNNASGTVLMNASASGKTINPGTSPFYNLQIGAPSGGYTMYSATTTNNFTLASANIFTVNPGSVINVEGVFSNTVGGVATTWTNSTLKLNGANSYSINSRANAGDVYGTLAIGPNSDIKTWYSSAATTTVDISSSLYSQDNVNVNGNLYIYGDLVIATTTEYWNYARDFDGTDLTGSERKVTVSFAPNATTTVTTGSLQIIGASGFETSLKNQGTGTYALIVNGGTLNANYYEMTNLNILGLQLKGLSTITNLANGFYELSVDTGSLISLASTTLNANPSKIFNNVGFNATTSFTGVNINLSGTTANAWRFTNSYGNIDGEAFDIDGVDACGSIRFDDSSCLLTEQTHVRWRNDNGGEGVPDSEWFNTNWDARKSVRVVNADATTYTNAAVQLFVNYDSDMQADFGDLYFTDSTGTTSVPFWISSTTNSGVAEVWVKVSNLPASDMATLYMYYKNPTATTTYSSSTQVFIASDSFEDGNISEYSGQTSLFGANTAFNYDASYGLDNNGFETSRTNLGGIYRNDQTVSQGQTFRYLQYVDTAAGSGDEVCTKFGVATGAPNSNYAVCLEQFGVDRISLVKNVVDNDSSGTVLATSTVSFTTGWYEVEVDWGTDDSFYVSLSNMAGTVVASVTASDSTYTSGGYGFSFWFHNGGWDAVSSRPTLTTEPQIFFGAEQADGGATWLAARNAPGLVDPNDVVRLRVAVENSGLDITGHQYRLEYAAKAAAPTCESVSSGSYAVVPNQASCGSSPICMQTSTFVSNGDSTTDKLIGTNGQFTAGKIVTSPSNQASSLNINQDSYTELEYVITPTNNASDDYCFRVTNAGTELDFYANIAKLELRFEPSFGAVALNAGSPISLTPGTTTPVTVLGTVTDVNGYADLAHATATIYRSGAGASCTADNNNCYIASTDNGMCSFTSCAGNSCQLSCTVDIFFHADPTDASTFEGEEWLAYAEASDFSAGYDFASAPGVELITLRALDVDSLINYGSLEADSNTGAFNPSTTITNLGNVPINIDIEGTNLTDGNSSSIPAEEQKVATSTFTYSSCVTCQQLSTSTPVMVGINLGKPSNIFPPVVTDVYWGIAVPFSASAAPHSGTNIFTPIGVD